MNDNELAALVQRELSRIGQDVSAGLNAGKERHAVLQAEMLEIQQRLSRRGGTGGGYLDGPASSAELRSAIETSDGFANIQNGGRGRVRIDLPAQFFAPRAALTGAEQLGQTERATSIAPLPMQRTTIRELLPVVPTDAAAVSWLVETGSPAPAEVVTEGEQKPESSLALELKTCPVVTIAVYAKASSQILSDIESLLNFISLRLRFMLSLAEEKQLLMGSGIGNNLKGLYTAATEYTDSTTGTPTLADTLRRAIADLEVNGFLPSGIVLHPNDFASLELAKDDEERYLIGQPRGTDTSVLWTIPTVRSASMTEGTFMVGDFVAAGQIHDRWTPRVEFSTEDGDNFRFNLCTIRAECRLALAVHQGAALRKGTFT